MIQTGILIVLALLLFESCDPQPIALTVKPISNKYLEQEHVQNSHSKAEAMLSYSSSSAIPPLLQSQNDDGSANKSLDSFHNLSFNEFLPFSSFHVYNSSIGSDILPKVTKAEQAVSAKEASPSLNKGENVDVTPTPNEIVLKLNKDYTPFEIAEYIYTTGDERGIVQAVSDMVADGQIMESIDDVILFLERVQKELEKMRRKS